jgi:E3 ubiquitin-protein ligase HECTD1
MQFLKDQYLLRTRSEANAGGLSSEEADAAARAFGAPACLVQALQKVSLKNWSLGYMVNVADPCKTSEDESMADVSGADMDVDSPVKASPGEPASPKFSPVRVPGLSPALNSGLPAKKRRRTGSTDSIVPDEVAREMYSCFTAVAPAEGGGITGPHQLLARCGDNRAVTDAIELLHLLKAQGPALGVEASLWVSSKLDRKLRYQLEDPLSVVSGTLPLWATTLPRLCPFLFSLKTRKMLLKYTAFGPSFAVHWTQESKVGSFLRRRATVQTELNAQMDPRKIQELSQELSNIEEHVVKSNYWLGTLQSTLVRMQKGDDLLRQADVAMEIISSSSHLVETQFEGETGFGSAVTQSFYVEVAQMLQDRSTNRTIPMWLEDDDSTNSQYLLCRRGLMARALPEGTQRAAAVKRFRFLGRLMGQALREGFIVPIPLAEDFFSLMLGEQLGPANFPHPGSGSAGELCGVLADFAAELASFATLQQDAGRTPEECAAWRKEQGERDDFGDRFLHHHAAEPGQPTQRLSFDQYASMVGVCFVETGLSGAPLCPDGENLAVTVDNVNNFVDLASRFWFETGVADQIEAFRAGLNDIFPFECLVAFSRTELREMFCGEDRIEWDEQALLSHFHPVGGLSDKSPTYKNLVAELLEMSQAERARFLDFVSSCPRLPPGGLANFHVDVFPDSTSKQGYPRSRACANQLYLPPYASKEELHEKLHEAMHSSAGHHEQRMRDL